VLGLGVYLFVEVRAQPAAAFDRASRPSRPETLVVPQTAAHPTGSTGSTASAPVAARSTSTASAASTVSTLARAARPSEPPAAAAGATGSAPEDLAPGPKLDAVMGEANKAYDSSYYDEAKAIAARVLARYPTNVRMLRIMVSASCIDGDGAAAQAYYAKLPPSDQDQMKVRCGRYGIAFGDH